MNYKGKDLAMYFYKSGSRGGLVGITEVDSVNGKYFLTNGFMGVYLIEEEVENFINKWNSYSSRTDIPLERFKKEKNICLEHKLVSNKALSDKILLDEIPANKVTLTPFVDQTGVRMVYTEDFIIVADNNAIEFVKSAGVDLITAAAYSALYFFKNEEILGYVMPKTMKKKDKEKLNKIIDKLHGKDIINIEKTG
jgi:hypothetical protein